MRADRSAQQDRANRKVAGGPVEAGPESSGPGETEATFEALFACPSLTHSLALALQGEGVEVRIEPCAAGPREAVIRVPAGKKKAAITILLQALRRKRWRPGGSARPSQGLTA